MAVRYIDNQKDFNRLCAELSRKRRIAFDIETQGLDPLQHKILLLSFSWPVAEGVETAVVRRYGLDLSPLRPIFETTTALKIIHNVKFEYKMMLAQESIPIDRYFCTYLAEKLLYIGAVDGFGLDDLTKRYLDKEMSKEQQKTFIGMPEDGTITPEQIAYAGADTAVLLDIFAAQLEKLTEAGLVDLMKLELRLVPVLARMEIEGMEIDEVKWRSYLVELRAKIDAIAPTIKAALTPILSNHYDREFVLAQGNYRKRVKEMAAEKLAEYRDGPYQNFTKKKKAEFDEIWLPIINGEEPCTNVDALPTRVLQAIHKQVSPEPMRKAWASLSAIRANQINLNSSQQLIEAYHLAGIELGVDGMPKWQSKSATPSTDAEAIAAVLSHMRDNPRYANLYETTKLLHDYKDYQKQESTFGDEMLNMRHQITGRLHPEFNQYGAETGRMSANRPNIMQIPNRGDKRIYREFFIANRDEVLIKIDYSQIEVRIAAHVSEDPTLIQAYSENLDLHSFTASLISGIPYDEIQLRRKTEKKIQDLRTHAKTVMFGIAYAMSEFGLAARTGMGLEEAREFIVNFKARYPVLIDALDTLGQIGQTRGYATTLAGRIRWFRLPDQAIDPASRKQQLKSIYRQARNHPIQGTSADITKLAGVLIAERAAPYGGRPVNFVHDEIVTAAPARHADVVADIAQSAMLEAARNWITKVPVEVETSIGNSWGG